MLLEELLLFEGVVLFLVVGVLVLVRSLVIFFIRSEVALVLVFRWWVGEVRGKELSLF